MLFFWVGLTVALTFRNGIRQVHVSMLGLDLLRLSGSIQSVYQQMVAELGDLSVDDVQLEGAYPAERMMYFKSLQDGKRLPALNVFVQMTPAELSTIRIADQWSIFEQQADMHADRVGKLDLARHILQISTDPANDALLSWLNGKIMQGMSYGEIMVELWNRPIPFINGDRLHGPFAQTLLLSGIPQHAIQQYLPLFAARPQMQELCMGVEECNLTGRKRRHS